MIHFSDGHSITFEEAAQLVEKEGRLGNVILIDNYGLRCLIGVLVDFKDSSDQISAYCKIVKVGNKEGVEGLNRLWMLSDTFRGTPEERAIYVAAQLRTMQEE